MSADATVLVTGGLGGIGLAMARWLVDRGARHVVLLGRTPMPPRERWSEFDFASAQGRRAGALAAMEAAGAKVETAAVDVGVPGALERCLAGLRERGAPPVRGVIHAAGVLQFQSLDMQDPDSLRAGLAAKVEGAWQLHRLFAEEPLDFFVMCSSTSALLASPLLGGYAAGNAFLDALAHYRRARGMPALAVNWGTWGEVGMAVEAGRSASGSMLTGVGTLSTARALAALQELLAGGVTQAAVMPVDWPALAAAYPGFAADPFLQSLVASPAGGEAGRPADGLTQERLRALPAGERETHLRDYLRKSVSQTLGMKVERLEASLPLSTMGFDSLMAVQLKNRIETDLGIIVPMIQFLQGPSVDQLVPTVLAGLASAPEAKPRAEVAEEAWEVGSI